MNKKENIFDAQLLSVLKCLLPLLVFSQSAKYSNPNICCVRLNGKIQKAFLSKDTLASVSCSVYNTSSKYIGPIMRLNVNNWMVVFEHLIHHTFRTSVSDSTCAVYRPPRFKITTNAFNCYTSLAVELFKICVCGMCGMFPI